MLLHLWKSVYGVFVQSASIIRLRPTTGILSIGTLSKICFHNLNSIIQLKYQLKLLREKLKLEF